MSDRAKGILLTLLEIVLCLIVAGLLLIAVAYFRVAVEGEDIWPYLAPERMEERQFKWALCGTVYLLWALPFLGTEIALRLFRRKQRRKSDEH